MIGVPSILSARASDYFDPLERYLTSMNYTNSDMITVMTDFYNDLVSNNLFDKLEYCHPFAADASGNQTEILRQDSFNLVNSWKYGLQYQNSPTADLIGVQWSITNQAYAITGFTPSVDRRKITTSTACAGAYQTTNAGNSADFGSNGTSGSFSMACNLGTDTYDSVNSGITYSAAPVSSIGLNVVCRTNDFNNFQHRRNGVQALNWPAYHSGFCDLPILLGALGPTSNNLWSDNKVCHHFMASFTLAELQTYETLVNNLQGDIEVALGLSAGDRKKY